MISAHQRPISDRRATRKVGHFSPTTRDRDDAELQRIHEHLWPAAADDRRRIEALEGRVASLEAGKR